MLFLSFLDWLFTCWLWLAGIGIGLSLLMLAVAFVASMLDVILWKPLGWLFGSLFDRLIASPLFILGLVLLSLFSFYATFSAIPFKGH
jgi:hypothetical protein